MKIICPYCNHSLSNNSEDEMYVCISVECLSKFNHSPIIIEYNLKDYFIPIINLEFQKSHAQLQLYIVSSNYDENITEIYYESTLRDCICNFKYVPIEIVDLSKSIEYFKKLIEKTLNLKAFI